LHNVHTKFHENQKSILKFDSKECREITETVVILNAYFLDLRKESKLIEACVLLRPIDQTFYDTMFTKRNHVLCSAAVFLEFTVIIKIQFDVKIYSQCPGCHVSDFCTTVSD
jgi:hypothetical protein